MTQPTDLERVLDVWLADGPTQVPDAVFDEAVANVYRARQRAQWRLRWRDLNVSTRLLAASIAVLAFVGVGMYAVGQRPISAPAASPSAAPSSTPVAAATPGAPRVNCLVDGTPREPCLGALEAGTYRLNSPLVPFSVTVPAGWKNAMNILGGAMLEPQDGPSGAAIYVWPDPVIADQTACQAGPDADHGRRVVDIVAFLTANPGLEVTGLAPQTLGGLAGQSLRMEAVASTAPCGAKVSLFVHDVTIEDGMWWDLTPGRTMGVWLLEAGDGHTVLVNVEARDADFDAFLAEATPIVESMQFIRQSSCVDGSRCLGALTAGTYTTGEIEVPLTFTVPEGWVNDWAVPLGYALVPAGTEDATEGGIFVFLDVYASTQASCSRQPADGVGRGAADLVAWLRSLPDVSITTPEAVTVGGLSGTLVDVSVTSAGPVCSGDHQLWVSDYPPLWWGLTPGKDRMRHYLLDLPGRHNVLVVVSARETTFDAFTATAEPIIESFDFDVAP